jgi:regulator of protease activity HflC (stomatin/prohibitin superfamily)
VRTRGVVESRLLWPVELQHGFIVVVAHQVSKDRRQEDNWSPSQSLISKYNQSTSVDGYVYMRR